MGYCYDKWGKICCDVCGSVEKVRKQKCPYGYCAPQPLCSVCRAKPELKEKRKAAHEGHCKVAKERFDALQATEAAALAAGKYVRVAARSVDGADGGPLTHVIFRNAEREEVGFYMEPHVYALLPLTAVTTPEDYQARGTLLSAPISF